MDASYRQPNGTTAAWLSCQSVSSGKCRQWRKLVFLGALRRNPTSGDQGSVIHASGERSAVDSGDVQVGPGVGEEGPRS